MRPIAKYVFQDPDVAETLSTIHYKYVVVPAYKVPNNIFPICKKCVIDYKDIIRFA